MAQHPVSPIDFEFPRLEQAAREVARHAYAPYSRFQVGAALLLDAPDAGMVATGCNVENASFRLTTCAEQAAVAAAVARYGPGVRIAAVAVVNLNGAACSPCGACRQTLMEFGSAGTRVAFPGANGTMTFCFLIDLLPFAFRFAQA